MARGMRLSAKYVERSKELGLHCDGGNLWLQVTPSKDGKRLNRSWVFRYTLNGVTRNAGLGSTATIDLKTAREKAREYRALLHDGIDPIEHRNAERSARMAANAKAMTFEEAAHAYLAAHRDEWRSQSHAANWPASLRRYIFPSLGTVDCAHIDAALVVQSLQKVWKERPATASRLRGRIESILDYAKVKGSRQGDNPARWSGNLEYLLAAPSKRKISHHAALPWREIPAFVQRLADLEGPAARAFEFAILTAARSGEVRGAIWSEIDLGEAVWKIPGSRMKAGKEHRVPLSARCVEILRAMPRSGEFVFPGRDGMLGESTFQRLLRKLDPRDLTVHGFRSCFMDWAHERTAFAKVVIDMALAHTVGDKVEEAYRRGDLFEKRRQLMQAWADYCASPQIEGKVIPIGSAAHA